MQFFIVKSQENQTAAFFSHQIGNLVVVVSFILSTQNQDGLGFHALQGIPAGIDVGRLGVVDIVYPFYTGYFLQTVFHPFEVVQCFPDTFFAYARNVGRYAGCHGIEQIMGSCQGQFFLFHIEGDRSGEIHLILFCERRHSFLVLLGKREILSVNAILVEFPLYDGVIVPEDESVIVGLVLDNPELGVHVILHFIAVTVQMVGSDVHQYSDVGMKFIHVVELETAEFDDVVVKITFSHLICQALSDVSGQSHVQSCFLKDMVNQGSGSCLSITSGDANHFCIRITSCKFNFRNDGSTLILQF